MHETLAEAQIRTLKVFQMRILALLSVPFRHTTLQMPDLGLNRDETDNSVNPSNYQFVEIAACFVSTELLFIPPEY
jgi:hypothetical protein